MTEQLEYGRVNGPTEPTGTRVPLPVLGAGLGEDGQMPPSWIHPLVEQKLNI